MNSTTKTKVVVPIGSTASLYVESWGEVRYVVLCRQMGFARLGGVVPADGVDHLVDALTPHAGDMTALGVEFNRAVLNGTVHDGLPVTSR